MENLPSAHAKTKGLAPPSTTLLALCALAISKSTAGLARLRLYLGGEERRRKKA